MSRAEKSIRRPLFQRIMASIAAGVLTIQGAAAVLPSKAFAESPDLSVNWYSGYVITVPELKPVWTAQADSHRDMIDAFDSHRVVAEDGKVFAFDGAKLIAIDASTGKRLWTYGKNLMPYVVYHNGTVYGLTGERQPFALNAKTGQKRWESATSTLIDARLRTEALVPTNDTLYAIYGSTTFAFDIATGKLRWTADEPLAEGNGTAYLEEADGVVLRTYYVQGALTSIQLNAYDKKTGKKLWGEFGQGEALRIQDGLVYSINYYSPMLVEYQSTPDRSLIVNAYNLRTGALKGTREYTWKMAGEPPYEWGQRFAFMSGGKLYIQQADRVAEYDFDAYKAGAEPLRTFNGPSGHNSVLLNIVQDRLIYQDLTTGELEGVKLANGQRIGWMGDAPVAQIDVYGNGMYRAQRNGTLLGIDMLTTKPVFKVKTGADWHGATLKTGDMLVIQAEGKLLGVKVPASLQ
ncbi:PQQ-binding-like beta-propeller repeat protein [Paenibacillus thailandensis]|uniref:PQQ-binding-like beta-propeller repeat protein n=1 Tax=Paenibacillus thailandensis TaxID=393250 RepID=A0ABW5QYL1_9BACL